MLMAECVRGLDFTVKASDNFRQCPRAAKDGKSKPASGLCTQPREAQGAPSNERQAVFRRRHRPAPTRSDKKGRALVTVRCGTLLLFTLLRLLLPERQQPIPAARDGVSLNLRTSSQQGGTGDPRRFASQRMAAHSLDHEPPAEARPWKRSAWRRPEPGHRPAPQTSAGSRHPRAARRALANSSRAIPSCLRLACCGHDCRSLTHSIRAPCPAWIRTMKRGSKDLCDTISPQGSRRSFP